MRGGAAPGADRGDVRGGRHLSEFDPDAFEPDATPPNGIPIVDAEAAAQLLGAPSTDFATEPSFGRPIEAVLGTGLDSPADVDPGRALARSLLVWGSGLIGLGSQAGWLLLGLEALWVAALVLSAGLLPTDDWLVCYVLLATFIVVWVGQAIWAYRVARGISGRVTGAAWLLAAAPALIVVLTGFWLVAGALASPAAAFQRYVGAWQHADVAGATSLFASPALAKQLTARWSDEDELISDRIEALVTVDPTLDLNVQDPRSNLRFMELPGGPSAAAFEVQIVHDVSVPSTFLGFIPASRTETQVLAVLGQVMLARHPIGGWLAATGAGVWQIEGANFDGDPP